jgi:hypothetical protein
MTKAVTFSTVPGDLSPCNLILSAALVYSNPYNKGAEIQTPLEKGVRE